MKRFVLPVAFLTAATLLTIYIAGCNNNDNPAEDNQNSSAPKVVATYPADGASGVAVDAPISVVFNGPMDTSSVRLGFHLAGGQSMMMWMDSLGQYGGMGHMGGGMGGMDPDDIRLMITWMDSIQVPGTFEWGQNLDSCRFVPESALGQGTSYLMFLYGDVMGQNHMMMNMGGLATDSLMYRFSTSQ
jgi:hypothetical protein